MRKRPTKSEALLWAQLQGRKLGVRFRRQAPVDNFILDFYAACARLGVEVDGGVHDTLERRRYDALRSEVLLRFYGIRVVRVRAELVERDVRAAVAVIRAALG
jgi:very-short-patch-repair endonuclease